MKALLLALLILLYFQSTFSQTIDTKHPSIIKLQKKYNEAIKISMTTEKLPWNSAVIIADAAVNHIMDVDFNEAERYMRSLDQKTPMMKLDSAIQFTVIFNGFAGAPELANVRIHDPATVTKALQEGRRKTKFPRIAMEMASICTGSSIQLAQRLLNKQVGELNIFFDKESVFNTVQPALAKLAASLSKSAAKFQSFPGRGSDSDKLFCTFFNGSGDLAQLKVTYNPKDYFGKILDVEIVEKGKFEKEESNPPLIEQID